MTTAVVHRAGARSRRGWQLPAARRSTLVANAGAHRISRPEMPIPPHIH